MTRQTTRREFVRSAATVGAALGFLPGLPAVSAAEARWDPAIVQFDPQI